MMFDAPATMTSFIAAGKVLALATTGVQKSDVLPNVPILADTAPGSEALNWLGLMSPKNTPADTVIKLNASVTAIISKQDIKPSIFIVDMC
jgi:tripartite-type tricarboxylate transporter receptor subunit TctC